MALTVLSSNQEGAVSSHGGDKNLRSCLKRPSNLALPTKELPRKKKSIGFGADQIQLIVPLSNCDLWYDRNSLVDRWQYDSHSLCGGNNASAMDYVQAHQMAYDQLSINCGTHVNDSNKTCVTPLVASGIQVRLLLGVNGGHRGLERFDPRFDERKARIDRFRHAILLAQQQQHKDNIRLDELSQYLSRVARQWALFVASIDAVAAIDVTAPVVPVKINSADDSTSTSTMPQQPEKHFHSNARPNITSSTRNSSLRRPNTCQSSIPTNSHNTGHITNDAGNLIAAPTVIRGLMRGILERSKSSGHGESVPNRAGTRSIDSAVHSSARATNQVATRNISPLDL